MKLTRRFAALATIVAIVLSPLVATSASAAVPQITGDTGWSVWLDNTLDAEMKVGVPYSSTVQGPNGGDFSGIDSSGLPDGLTATLNPLNGVITVSGTPTAEGSDIGFWLSYQPDSETTYTIEFSGVTVLSSATPTTTTVSTAAFSPYTGVNLGATVNAPFGGSVAFYLDDTLVATVPLAPVGTAEYTGAVPASFVGSSPVVTAVYSGDATHAGSSSTSDPTVYIYGDRTISGMVLRNGQPQVGTTVTLLTSDFNPTGLTDTTDATGAYSFTLAAPTTLAEATAGYAVQAGTGLYFSAAGGWKQTNATSLSSATVVYEGGWTGLTIYLNIYPTWVDQTLAQPRMGEAYSDSVTATTEGTPNTLSYSIRSGTVPSWLSFSDGTFTSAGPTDQLAYTFEVQVDSNFGVIYKQFTLQAGDAGVAPTFTDTDIADLQVGTPVTDGVAATGDPTIVYTSTPLPDGLVLDSATGAITGSPTTAGEYTVTFTATNDFGSDDYTWEPTIAAAPEIDLVLQFGAGTTLGNAQTEISADGLKVGSTYTLDMHSTPVRLYTGIVDNSGGFVWLVNLPADTPVGAHELILTGVAPDGTVMTAHAWFTLLADGTIGAVSYTGAIPFRLAFTGTEPIVPMGIAAALLLGGYLLSRRGWRRAQV